ncbi:MAG: Rrf2 family transcriptional regulator [Sedimentisphaerales bacterium]
MKVKKSAAYALHALAYMVRHKTQLPVTTKMIAKSEGIPADYLAKVFQTLTKAGFVKSVRGKKKGYIFDRQPEDISLLKLIEATEGGPIFKDCFLRHCQCGGTPDNCRIYSIWINSTKKVLDILRETTIESVAWNHPDHRFNFLPESVKIAVDE